MRSRFKLAILRMLLVAIDTARDELNDYIAVTVEAK